MNQFNTDDTDSDQTTLASSGGKDTRLCPICGTPNDLPRLAQDGYRCRQCRNELAHVDYAPNGSVRGIFGWLLAPGDVALDRYRIQSVLGKGGFGAAYLADDLQLSGKRRALKEVPAPMFDEYETNLLSRLDHPAIPDIIERREVGGMYYLVLKFGGSRTLDSERKQQPEQRIPQERLLPWMRQLCEVLIYLHSQTPPIIHRDLKPGNVLLDENDRIMLIDFGIAKEAAPESMTRTLGRAATLYFSPPEQVMGTGTDERADIYALGATFYALLTGQNPPAAHERVSGKDLPPPSDYVPEVLPEVEAAILQALSLNMNHRQQTMREFAAALGFLEGSEASRPIRTEPMDQRTIAVGQAGSMPPSLRSGTMPPSARSGLQIPTGRATAGTRGTASAPLAEPAPPAPGNPYPAPLLVGAGAALAAIAVGAYLFLSGKPSEPDSPKSTASAPAATVQPATQLAVPMAPVAPPAAAPQSAPVPESPPAAGTPAPPVGSAMDALRARDPSTSEPAAGSSSSEKPPEPRADADDNDDEPKPSGTAKPKKKVVKPPPKKTRSGGSSSRGGGAGPSDWTIIRGGSYRTN